MKEFLGNVVSRAIDDSDELSVCYVEWNDSERMQNKPLI
jgi:hypothetical protein